LSSKLAASATLQSARQHLPNLSEDQLRQAVEAVHQLGLVDATEPVDLAGTPIDSLCALLQKKLRYGEKERDMVIMQHRFDIVWGEHKQHKTEHRRSTLIQYGAPGGYSAMAKTVGLPAAIAADLLLSGITQKSFSKIVIKKKRFFFFQELQNIEELLHP